jgi:hypothetical protein
MRTALGTASHLSVHDVHTRMVVAKGTHDGFARAIGESEAL